MNHKIGDIVKWHPKAVGRIVAHQRYLKGYGPKNACRICILTPAARR